MNELTLISVEDVNDGDTIALGKSAENLTVRAALIRIAYTPKPERSITLLFTNGNAADLPEGTPVYRINQPQSTPQGHQQNNQYHTIKRKTLTDRERTAEALENILAILATEDPKTWEFNYLIDTDEGPLRLSSLTKHCFTLFPKDHSYYTPAGNRAALNGALCHYLHSSPEPVDVQDLHHKLILVYRRQRRANRARNRAA